MGIMTRNELSFYLKNSNVSFSLQNHAKKFPRGILFLQTNKINFLNNKEKILCQGKFLIINEVMEFLRFKVYFKENPVTLINWKYEKITPCSSANK